MFSLPFPCFFLIGVFFRVSGGSEDGGGGDPEEPGVRHSRHGRDDFCRLFLFAKSWVRDERLNW